MAKANVSNQLGALIISMQQERQKHVDAIAQIDTQFERFGIKLRVPPKRGRPAKAAKATAAPKAAPRRRRKRGQFKTSGLESVAQFVKAGGAKGRTTAEVNKHWKEEGRAGSAYIAIGQLVKAKKLKKQELKGQRGSRYTA